LSDFTVVVALEVIVREEPFVISLLDTEEAGLGFCEGCLTLVLPLVDVVVLELPVRIVCC
jgi:hypothetical protein